MKNIKDIIVEKLKLNKDIKLQEYEYFPKSKRELWKIIEKIINKEGNKANLNMIDVSKVTSMAYLFYGSDFNGDISQWDVSNINNMSHMFRNSEFDGDISQWNIKNVKHMDGMFYNCPLENNPPKWYDKNLI